jgi:ABC-type nitrate/sulfonate/bicarbonate transport system substrate-binding protein
VDQGLKRLLIDAGLDLDRDGVHIVGVPGASEPGVSFGVAAAKALEDGKLDGFWANAMGAETAVRRGVGKVVLDVRRGLGPRAAFHYTMPVLATSDHAIKGDPNMAAAGVRAVVKAQQALKRDPSLATRVGKALFPPAEAALIADVVARDLPYYDPTISEAAVDGLNRFSQERVRARLYDEEAPKPWGILQTPLPRLSLREPEGKPLEARPWVLPARPTRGRWPKRRKEGRRLKFSLRSEN